MHKNDFILCVKHNGKVLREIDGREVQLPYDEEYSLLIKNNHSRRALCRILIDGTDILGGQELIINNNSSFDLERFLTNGNLNEGKKFKFVRLSDEKVTDPTNPENGLIEVEFWLEKQWNYTLTWGGGTYTPYTAPQWNKPYAGDPLTGQEPQIWSQTANNVSAKTFATATQTMSVNTCQVSQVSNAGATVEGATSKQSFTTSYFGEKEYPSTIMRLWLRAGFVRTVKDDIHCTNCGTIADNDDAFCRKCGIRIKKK